MTPEEVKLLDRFVNEFAIVRKMVFHQRAQIDALGAFVCAELANATGVEAKVLCDRLEDGIRKVYDGQIVEIEKKDPAYAARIDMRPDFSESDQSEWYLP
ncbi:MAG TPA: hypothetical protein VK530_06760 [Candidatus Acidoferrum sp.]|nr:hypothetical protein [Candidatus Acidoferrum sp.]